MITINLNKMETALEQVRKAKPKLKPSDAAHLTTALVLAGRHAKAVYDDVEYQWPEDTEKLTTAMVPELEQVNQSSETTVKKTKTSPEEEPVVLTVELTPNQAAGEKQLEGREDLKAVFSDFFQEGVEYTFQANDVGWQWGLERVNWNTVSVGELTRRIKIRTLFTRGATGVELGTGSARKRGSRAKT